jgi:hypothetical protein
MINSLLNGWCPHGVPGGVPGGRGCQECVKKKETKDSLGFQLMNL